MPPVRRHLRRALHPGHGGVMFNCPPTHETPDSDPTPRQHLPFAPWRGNQSNGHGAGRSTASASKDQCRDFRQLARRPNAGQGQPDSLFLKLFRKSFLLGHRVYLSSQGNSPLYRGKSNPAKGVGKPLPLTLKGQRRPRAKVFASTVWAISARHSGRSSFPVVPGLMSIVRSALLHSSGAMRTVRPSCPGASFSWHDKRELA
jgi:hypothetical protein